jgi:hypothetical protein
MRSSMNVSERMISEKQTRLRAFQNAAQTAVGILAIADERDALGFDDAALGHFEDQIDAVFVTPDDDRVHRGRQTPRHAISLGDGGGVLFGTGRRIDPARLRLEDAEQIVIVDAAVALDRDAVDRRELHHADHQRVAARDQLNRFEQAGALQVLQRVVHLPAGHPGTGRDARERDDRLVGDALIALDLEVRKAERLSLRLRRGQRKSDGHRRNCGKACRRHNHRA